MLKGTEIPVTDVVIKAVEVMAHNQGFKNLKFKNRHGVIFHDADWLAGVDYEDEDEDEDECEENANEDEEYEDSEEQDIELKEAKNIDPREIDDIIDNEANPNQHQDAGVHQEDDGDHQESEENIGIEESGEEPGVPSESETYEPLDPPDNESDAGDVESGPSNLDAEQEEELMISEPPKVDKTIQSSNVSVKIPPGWYFLVALVLKSTAVLIPHLEVSLGRMGY